MKTHYQDLEEQVEYWRYRAEEAEARLARTPSRFRHIKRIPGLSPTQSAIMRLLAERDLSGAEIQERMDADGVQINENTLKVQLCLCRRLLPKNIAPSKITEWGGRYSIPDRQALKQFVDGKAQTQ